MTSWPCQALLSMELSRQEYWSGMSLLFSCSAVPDSLDPMDHSTPGFPVLHHLPELAQTHVHWVSDAIQPFILCHPLLLPSVFPSIRIFSSESVLHIRWLKYWSFSFSISPSVNIQDWFPSGLTGLISLQCEGLSVVFSNTAVQKHQFFHTQPSLWSNSYIYTWLLGKTVTLTTWTFVCKVMSLLFSMLSWLVIAFLPRSKHLLTSWLL